MGSDYVLTHPVAGEKAKTQAKELPEDPARFHVRGWTGCDAGL